MKIRKKEKRLLLEFLGLSIVKDELGLLWVFEKGADVSGMLLEEYDPVGNESQLLEILERLNEGQKSVIPSTLSKLGYEPPTAMHSDITITIWYMKHKYEVLEAILAVTGDKK